MFLPIFFIVAMVSWSLHLMWKAIEEKEFSLMFAGCLVAASAVATVAVCFLMGSYIDYMHRLDGSAYTAPTYADSQLWTWQVDEESDLASRPMMGNFLDY